MDQSLVFTLLALSLVLPILGAVGLRRLMPRLSGAQLYATAGLGFAVVFGSVLVLARADVSSIQIGQLSLLLPVAAPFDEAPENVEQQPVEQPTPLVEETAEFPTAEPADTGTPAASPTAATTATAAATATTAATLTPEPTETLEPTATATLEPPTETPAPSGRRTYVVQPGDTLRGIAEQFDVTVSALLEANNLTAEQADSLRPGQELVIP
jgi:LysM repeat protein